MSDSLRYIPNGGQTYQPVQDNIHVPFKAYDPPAKPSPLLPPLELSDETVEKGYALPSQKQHFLGPIWRNATISGLPDRIRNFRGCALPLNTAWGAPLS